MEAWHSAMPPARRKNHPHQSVSNQRRTAVRRCFAPEHTQTTATTSHRARRATSEQTEQHSARRRRRCTETKAALALMCTATQGPAHRLASTCPHDQHPPPSPHFKEKPPAHTPGLMLGTSCSPPPTHTPSIHRQTPVPQTTPQHTPQGPRWARAAAPAAAAPRPRACRAAAAGTGAARPACRQQPACPQPADRRKQYQP